VAGNRVTCTVVSGVPLKDLKGNQPAGGQRLRPLPLEKDLRDLGLLHHRKGFINIALSFVRRADVEGLKRILFRGDVRIP